MHIFFSPGPGILDDLSLFFFLSPEWKSAVGPLRVDGTYLTQNLPFLLQTLGEQ